PNTAKRGGGILVAAGTALVFIGVYRLIRGIEKLLKKEGESRTLSEIAWQSNRLAAGPRVVCLGGGTGLSTLLSGLKEYTAEITAVVSVADDGGSSGRLRLDFDLLPPGDIRNCLVALADAEPVMAEVMRYRFEEGEFAGHSFGNLFIAVLARLRGDFGDAVREANRILSVRGRVLAATLDKISLVATHPDGTKTTGQRLIAQCGKPISALELKPAPPAPPADVLEAIAAAEMIVIGPGSLYTSVLPILLDPAVVAAINRARAQVVFVVNTMGQIGETGDFTVSKHIKALRQHAPGLRLDHVLINNYRPSPARLEALAQKGIRLTEYDAAEVAALEVRVILRDIIDVDQPTRHDPHKLAKALMEIAAAARGG
ncbi:MAG: uridine diphosphate-N-acetylglucosamine-binding protein YvcK, partial [Planctomycetota bacterium]|nr:uridine diphosphate-N-acetylglucosamine-binding protein YvcK [Planctomycetota bacterium]